VALEQTSADILIQVESEVIVQDLNALFLFFSLLRILNTITKEVREPLEGVLVHGVNHS
jgi:hypothetical protein